MRNITRFTNLRQGLHGWISRRSYGQAAAGSSFQTTLPRTISMTRASGGTTFRIALSDDPDVEHLFKASRRRSAFYNQFPGVGQIELSTSESRELEKIERRLARATAVLTAKYGKCST